MYRCCLSPVSLNKVSLPIFIIFANHRCGYPQSACKLLGVLFLNDTRKPNVPLGAAAFIGEHDQLIPKMRVVLDKQSKTMLLAWPAPIST